MKRKQPQNELNMTGESFALVGQTTQDGERITRAEEQAAELDRQRLAEINSRQLLIETDPVKHSAFEGLSRCLNSLLAEEGLTPDIIDYVDVDVACSPVICFRGESPRDAVSAMESSDPNKFLLSHPLIPDGWVTRDTLRIMRARYLLATRGRPDPTPIATFKTDTEDGRNNAIESLSKLFGKDIASKLVLHTVK